MARTDIPLATPNHFVGNHPSTPFVDKFFVNINFKQLFNFWPTLTGRH